MHQRHILSRSIFERKWGICGLTIYKMFRNLSVDAKKQLKMSIENEIKKMDLKGVTQIRSEVKIALQKEKPSISLEKIYEFGLNKGIAVAAIKYSIDLFKLEYLIWKQCPTLWAQMKTNNWFLIPVRNWSQSKLGIIKMAESEGVLYTSKKCRINLETIYRYIETLNDYGINGLLKRKRWRYNEDEKADILEYRKTNSFSDTLRKYNISKSALIKWTKKY